jgi:hypothetical protein
VQQVDFAIFLCPKISSFQYTVNVKMFASPSFRTNQEIARGRKHYPSRGVVRHNHAKPFCCSDRENCYPQIVS